MKLIGNLKKQVEATNSKEEARNVIAKAGMMLTDDELNMVAGGSEDGIDEVPPVVGNDPEKRRRRLEEGKI